MKILHIIHKPQNRGAETFTCQLSNHLTKFGHTIKIISIFNGDAELPYKDEINSLHGNESSRFTDFRAWKRLSKIIKEFNPDIVQANAGDTLKYAIFSKKIFGWKKPIISRNASEVGRYLQSTIQKSLNSFFYKNVEFVISVSMASKKDIVNHFPFLSEKTEVIPVGLEPFSRIEKITLKPEDCQHIVHVGGFSFEKNHSELLKIFHKILKLNPRVHLHLVGDGPLKSKIEEESRNLGLTKFITFYGFVNNPLSYIKAANVLVLPSIIEGLPGVILEAMLCKTPVVANNVGGISEIVNENTGAIVEVGDLDAFTLESINVLENPNKLKVENAFKMVSENYMNEEIALKFIEFYKAVTK